MTRAAEKILPDLPFLLKRQALANRCSFSKDDYRGIKEVRMAIGLFLEASNVSRSIVFQSAIVVDVRVRGGGRHGWVARVGVGAM
jgi:hypothetical protein